MFVSKAESLVSGELFAVRDLLPDTDADFIPLPLLIGDSARLTAIYIAALSFWLMSLFPFMPAYCHYTVDKAGAYGAQEYGELIMERVEGSFSNVIGLPVERLRAAFEKLEMLSDLVS